MVDKKNVIRRLNVVSELASASLPHQTLVELLDTCRLITENHRGVCHYAKERICVRTHYGLLEISGLSLRIARMSKEQLVIVGNIFEISTKRNRVI